MRPVSSIISTVLMLVGLLPAPVLAQVGGIGDRPDLEPARRAERPSRARGTGVAPATSASRGQPPGSTRPPGGIATPWRTETRGQPRPSAAPASRPVEPGRRRRFLGLRDGFLRRSRWLQDEPPADAPAGRATTTPAAGAPSSIGQPGTPGAPETGVALPAPPGQAARARAPAVPPAPTPLLLDKALGIQDRPYRVYGWIENSFTGNANGVPRNHENFGVFPNHQADRWMGNQYYLTIENPLDAIDLVNFGFRFDMLFGNDWLFTKDYGLFDRAWHDHSFAGLDLPQIYGEVHLPVLTSLGLDLRAGRFFSLTGFESPQAIARPLLSVPYSLNFTPFTFFGAYANLRVHARLNIWNGTIDGFDRWPNKPYKWGYIGGMSWTSRDQKLNLVLGGADAYDQLPVFPPANSRDLPVGVPGPGFLSGRRNPYYNQSRRAYLMAVATYKWTARLTQALETDHVFDPEILGFGNPPQLPVSAAYHSFVNWFLYQITPKLTGVWRSELFWDPYGLATGNPDNYHEMTLGLVYKPKDYIWVRPEVRYDWAQFTHPFNDGTRSSQLTMGFDVIFLF